MKRFFLPLLFAVGGLQQVSASDNSLWLCVGDNAPIALHDIVNICLDATSMHIYQTDGQTVDLPLQPIAFNYITDLQQLPVDVQSDVPVCDVWGRPYKAGTEGLWVSRHGVSYGVSSHTSAPAVISPTRAAAPMALTLHEPGIDRQMAIGEVAILSFNQDETEINFDLSNAGYFSTKLNTLTSITFEPLQSTVSIQYDGETVDGVNPYYLDGLRFDIEGAHVVAHADFATSELEYELSGKSDNGSFKIYSAYKWQATLKGLALTNPQGPAINSQTGKKGTIKSQKNTVNVLCDGAEYAASDEDQKGCIFSEGQLIFSGKGELQVTSSYKHAICSDDYVSLENGKVTVLAAASDAIHANDSIIVQGCNVTLTPGADGLDTDGPVLLRANENGDPKLTITTTGDGAKGIKCGTDFEMSAGDVLITQTGKSGVKSDGKKDKVTGIKADNITITGGHVTIHNTAEDGKAYSADSVVGKEFITVE